MKLANLDSQKARIIGALAFFIVGAFFGGSIVNFLPAETGYVDEEGYAAQEHFVGKVTEVVSTKVEETSFGRSLVQSLKVEALSGDSSGQIKEVESLGPNNPYYELSVGDEVVMSSYEDGSTVIVDRYRLSSVIWIVALFFAVTVLIAGIRGFTSLLGLLSSVIVLTGWIIPQLLSGGNPFIISLTGAVIIATISLYLAHGINRRTSLALVSTLVTVFIAALLAELFSGLGHISGFGTEEASFLQDMLNEDVDLRGIILGGMIIGALGLLDDITTGQTAAVGEIKRANPKLGVRELFKRGMVVGREHIAALVNSLALAYVGAALPLFILFYVNQYDPLWVSMNREFLVEEVVRTMVGSLSLVLAVPISTILAARFLGDQSGEGEHYHRH